MNLYWKAKLEGKRVVKIHPKHGLRTVSRFILKHKGNQTFYIIDFVKTPEFHIGDVITNGYILYVVTDLCEDTYSLTEITKGYKPKGCSYIYRQDEHRYWKVPYKGKKLDFVYEEPKKKS